MVIVYCEKCGRRVSEGDIAEGHAIKTAGNSWLCEACAAPAQKPAVQRATTGVHVQAMTARRSGVAPPPRTVDSQAGPQQHAGSGRLAMGLVAGGACLLVAGVVLLCAGTGGGKGNAPVEANATPGASKEQPRRPGPPAASAPALAPAGQPAAARSAGEAPAPALAPASQPAAATSAGEAPAPEIAPSSLAERAKQAEKEMEDFRNQRAAKLLEEHQAWFKQNPSDPWTYQARLRELVGSYGSAPAAAEARRLVEELGALPPPPDRLEASAPESKGYQLVYDLNLARLGAAITYDVDNRSQVKQPFDRIAYFLELQPGSGGVQYLYVSMDAFTDDLGKIGVPTQACGARFQQNVANMNVHSNVEGIVTGTGLGGGNIEFWPNNYGGGNSANVPNASSQQFDFGDQPGDPVDGYGSMQVHNHEAKQTLFALNHWRQGGGADLGIGNRTTGNPDWTFSGSAGSYRMKRLRVLVHCK